MKSLLKIGICFAMIVFLGGCSKNQQLEKLANELNLSNKKIEKLEFEIIKLKREKLLAAEDAYALLTPGSTEFSPVKFALGLLTVSIVDIEPYANGSKVLLQFGNPLMMTVHGLKVKIDYGFVDENGIPQNDKQKTKEFSFIESLKKGSWTNISVILENISPQMLGFIRLRDFSISGIGLLPQL